MQALPDRFLAYAPQLHTLDLTLDSHALQALPDRFLAHTPQLHTLDLTLDLHALQALPDRFLAHAPQLQSLTLIAGVTTLPDRFLAYAPRLQRLALHVPSLNAWPANLAITAEGLQTLELNNYRGALPPPGGWLAGACLQDLTLSAPWAAEFLQYHAACLRNLDLEIRDYWYGPVTRWPEPEHMLEDFPHLETFTLTAINSSLNTLSDRFLAHAPQLQRLTLEAFHLTALPDRFLTHAPQLQHLTLQIHAPLPGRFLAHAPQLHTLDLHLFATTLPDHFLAHAPQLQHLTLRANGLTALPDRFLAHAPQLQHLTLRADGLTILPDHFLAHASQLRTLDLDLRNVTILPDRFLAHAPQLQHLTLRADGLTILPDHFLAHASQLRTLDLNLNVTVLPDRFLAHVPRLHTLDLYLDVAALPADFLAHASQLRTLDLGLNVTVLPDRFLAHVPRLHTLSLWAHELTVLPDRFLAYAPHLHRLGGNLANLTAIGHQVLTHAPQMETFFLNAPRLATVGEGFLARADRLREFILLAEGQTPLVLGAQFLAEAPQLETVRLGAWATPRDQYQIGAAALALPADFLADLPRLTTLQLGRLNDPPPPGFLRGTPVRDLHLRVRIAVDAQGAPRLPAVVRAATWRVELTCDSAYPAAWFAPLAAAPPTVLTVAPCAGPDMRQARSQGILPRLPAALSAFLADAPAPIRLQVADAAQLPSDAYAVLPVQALKISRANDIPAAALTTMDLAELHLGDDHVSGDDYVSDEQRVSLWPADLLAPPALRRLTLLGGLYSEEAPRNWNAEAKVNGAELADAATLAARRAGPGLEAVQLDFSRTSKWGVDTDLRALAAPFAAPAFLIDFKRGVDTTSLQATLVPLLRAPPAPIRHLGARTSLAKMSSQDIGLTAALQDLDFACLQLVLPDLAVPPPLQLRAAARRHGIDLRLVAGSHPHETDPSPAARWTLDAADYFHQHHLPWAAIHSCPRSLLLIDREGVWWGGGRHVSFRPVERLPPDLLDRPGTLQRVRLVFDPRRCPDCEPDAAPEVR